MWQLFIVGYFIFGAASYLLRRVLAKKLSEHNRLINAIFFLFFLAPTAVILSLFFPHDLDIGITNLLIIFGGSIIWPLLGIVSFRANKDVDVGIFAIISNLSPLFTLAIALTLLNERLSVLQFIGIGLLVVSGIVAASSHLKHNRASMQGILFCLLSAVILGVAVAFESFMLHRIDFGAYLIYGWGSQVVWSVILAAKDFRKLPALLTHADTKKILFAWSASSSLRSVAFISALKISGSAALISAITDFMSVVIVIAGYIFLHERGHMVQKVSGAIVGLVGLLLITG